MQAYEGHGWSTSAPDLSIFVTQISTVIVIRIESNSFA